MWLFTEAMLKGQPINVYNYGRMQRDFTYSDDIVQGVVAALMAPGLDMYEIINLGNHHAEELQRVIGILESELKLKAEQNLLPIQPGMFRPPMPILPGPGRNWVSSRSPPLRWGFPVLFSGILIITACRADRGEPQQDSVGFLIACGGSAPLTLSPRSGGV